MIINFNFNLNLRKRLKNLIKKYLNFVITKKFNNKTFKVPLIRGMGTINLKNNQDNIAPLLKKYFSKDCTLIDIGSNVGEIMLLWKSLGGPLASYIGFDPNPNCIYLMNEIIKLNKFQNQIILPIALGSKTKIQKIISDKIDSSMVSSGATLCLNQKSLNTSYESTYVAVFEAENIFKDLEIDNNNYLLKIDVEGFEFEILKSLKSFIKKNKPILIIEILEPIRGFPDEFNSQRTQNKESILQFFKEINYNIKSLKIETNKSNNEYLCLPRNNY